MQWKLPSSSSPPEASRTSAILGCYIDAHCWSHFFHYNTVDIMYFLWTQLARLVLLVLSCLLFLCSVSADDRVSSQFFYLFYFIFSLMCVCVGGGYSLDSWELHWSGFFSLAIMGLTTLLADHLYQRSAKISTRKFCIFSSMIIISRQEKNWQPLFPNMFPSQLSKSFYFFPAWTTVLPHIYFVNFFCTPPPARVRKTLEVVTCCWLSNGTIQVTIVQ